MTRTIKIRRVGGSLGAIFPKEMLDRVGAEEGTELQAIETDRGFLLTPFDPHFEAAMEAFETVRRQYRNTLRKLAEYDRDG